MWRGVSSTWTSLTDFLGKHHAHHIDLSADLPRFAKKSLFKIAFHGGLTNVWGGVMKIPEARQVKLCMTEHTECMSYEVLIIIVITIISMSLSLHMESYKVLICNHH